MAITAQNEADGTWDRRDPGREMRIMPGHEPVRTQVKPQMRLGNCYWGGCVRRRASHNT